tara:strand:- start:3622 stop:3924 length:303 start_codon:yes stop_codon:yes gene_type:complete
MVGILGWSPTEARKETLKTLTICYDSKVVTQWDHTASLMAITHNLSTIVISLGSKGGGKVKPKSAAELHPYRIAKKRGLRITGKDVSPLRMIGNAIAQRK